MRTALGLIGVSGLLCFAGTGLLVALGVTRPTLRGMAAALGLSYLTGAAATMLLGILLLIAGVGYRLPAFILACLVIGGAGFAVALRGSPRPQWRGRRALARPRAVRFDRGWVRVDTLLPAALVLALLSFLIIGFANALVHPLDSWDGWSIWARKAVYLLDQGFDNHLFANPAYSFAHPDYPILLPLFEATHMRAMGGADTQVLHAPLWILLAAFPAAAGFLAARVSRSWLWIPIVAAAVLSGSVYSQLLTAYADVPMAIFLGLGALCMGLWLSSSQTGLLVAGTLLLAAAANTKNEGLPGAAVVVVAAGIVLVAGVDWGRLLKLVIAGAGFLAVIAPWHLWLSAHHITSDLPISKGLDPSYVSDHSSRIKPAADYFLGQIESNSFTYIPALALALVAVGLFTRRHRSVSAFYGIAGFGFFASIVWAFVISPSDIGWQINTAGNRVIMGLQFVGVAALVQLSGTFGDPVADDTDASAA